MFQRWDCERQCSPTAVSPGVLADVDGAGDQVAHGVNFERICFKGGQSK